MENSNFSNLSLQNLIYLNIQETLADVANFVRSLRNESNKIILFGEDTGASFSVWTKKIYPDIIDGVLAYGPRLEAQIEFPEFFAVVGETLQNTSSQCEHFFMNALDELEDLIVENDGEKIQELFGLEAPLDTLDEKEVQWFRVYIVKEIAAIYIYERFVN